MDRGGIEAPDQDALGRAIARAMERIAKGDYAAAVQAIESGGRAVADHPVARNLLGNVYLQQGRRREALRAFEAAAKSAPLFAEAHCNRGVVLQELGRHDEALIAYDRALKLRAGYPLAHFNRGKLFAAMRRHEEAIADYGAAIRSQSRFAEAYLNRGNQYLKTGRPIDALNDFDRAISQRFGYREALLARAQALLALHRPAEALAVVASVLEKSPGDTGGMLLKATALGDLKRFAEELAVIADLLGHDPENHDLHVRRSTALKKLRRFEESLAAADEAVRLAGRSHAAHQARAVVLGELGRMEEGLEEVKKAEDLGASRSEVNWNRATALGWLGRHEEAIALYEETLKDNPDYPEMRGNYAFTLLEAGDFEHGWQEHERRLETHEFAYRELAQVAPPWKGEDIRGKKLLVYGEQGYGDAIQFVRYLDRVRALEAEITLVLSQALVGLFTANLPGVDVTDRLGLRSGFDRQVSLMSLPAVFGTRLETIPNQVPYLSADPEHVEIWRSRLAADSGLRVGLCWAGNPKHPRDHRRSVPLAALAPLSAIAGVRLVSLQVVNGLDQLENLPAGMTVEAPTLDSAATDGFADLAAIIANLDLVISIDSAVAHLAGAMAMPVWTMVLRESEWRWLRDRDDSPWYPTMRLLRQGNRGNWPEVIARMAEALGDLVARSA